MRHKISLKLLSALWALFYCASAFAAGTVPGFNLTPQFDKLGKVASGCRLYVIQSGTVSTPQNPYQDSGLTILAPNPMTCDATGRLPQWFVADGTIKLRQTDKNGVELFTGDNLLVIGASSGGGGGSPVDPTTILSTGDMKLVYGTGVLSGFVRANNRTIGSATSGATERANADTSALFSFLWNADPNLAVSGGRGASAAADFAANKTIALPDFRGRIPIGLADMGNSATTLLNGVAFNAPGTATTLGSTGGASFRTLLTANLPAYTPTGTVGTIVSGTASVNSVNWVASNPSDSTPNNVGSSGSGVTVSSTSGTVSKINSTGNITAGASSTFTGNAMGGTSTPLETIPPLNLVTFYLKL